MAAKAFETKLLRDVKEDVLQKYGRFVTQFDVFTNEFHEKNVAFINNSVILGNYNCPFLSEETVERTEIIELLQTCGNTQLNKVLLVFATLALEINHLASIAKHTFIDPLALYGEKTTDFDSNDTSEELNEMSKMLPILYDLLCYINRCFLVVGNLSRQMHALFDVSSKVKGSPNGQIVEVTGVTFDIMFEYLGMLSVALINIDEVIRHQSALQKDFVNHKRIIELVNANSSKFDVSESDSYKLKLLLALIVKIEKEIIDGGSIFRRMIDSMVNSYNIERNAKNSIVGDQFISFIKNSLTDFESDENKLKDDKRWLAINALFVIYVWLFKKDDRRLMRMILDSEKKTGILIVHLYGNCSVFPDRILNANLPKSMLDKKTGELLNQIRENIVKQNALEKDVKQLNFRMNNWMIHFENVFDVNESNVDLIDILQKQRTTLNEGMELLFNSSYMVKNYIFLHLHFGRSMSKSDLASICKLVNVIKSVDLCIARKKANVMLSISRYTQYCSFIALKCLTAMKERLLSETKKYSEKKLDMISAIILGSNCIHGPILSNERRILTSLCLAMAAVSMNESEFMKINTFLKKIKFCSNLFKNLKDWSNCEFMFFNTPVLGNYFNYFYNNEIQNSHELRYFCHGLSDCIPLISNAFAYDEEKKQLMIKKFENEVWLQFRTEFLDRLCTDFETELRLQTHRDLQLDDQSPFKKRIVNFKAPLISQPLRLFNKFISIKNYVENYLNEIAYNLTTIALHDWKTYESMLSLAKAKYGMEFVTSQLPTQTLEQGLDVLEITRNIHIFVSRYLYNLNNQTFIERSSENKHLNVLLIRHASNSIQTHGFGIINTAVNFTYQFLRKKFYIFSQFLYEEHIKSRLMKDLRHFRESKVNKFPFERAEKLVKGIRVLGLTPDGLSYLDQFRQLISQIGNALGFVRMLRSGALHCSSNSVNFVPDIEDIAELSFEALVREEEFGDQCINAGKNLDTILLTLNRNFSEATDYFKLLVDVFAATFQDSKNYHLRNFYVLLPSLTLNYVEHLIISKEKMNRKNKVGASFTDDGFPMGIAYILKLLEQYSEFESLQWFSSVKDKINAERSEAIKKKNATMNNGDEKLSQTINLTLKRLDVLEKEFDLLSYSLTSCRILFKGLFGGRDKNE
ncbi:WASH complex subunit 7-like protein [Dinothrombium tinctorium]|uniref:WASH complex subunit 7-like protein n=1 Tax=Dinothrombium tinctorium TaxID=1965070 RepID=A0A3S4RMI1_9ACAR|nr:WASH complex subunit 7-like protein [Dinothrombium tinctorium]